jgi:trehalose 6-phosphate synthase/phosphatase
MVGKKNVECRVLAINKGEIVKKIIYQNPDADFLFCAGDDKTDEEMFRQAKSVFPSGGRVAGQAVTMAAPIAVTSIMDEEEAEKLPEVEIKLTPEHTFATAVGPSTKKTLASSHLTCPEEVVQAMEAILQ